MRKPLLTAIATLVLSASALAAPGATAHAPTADRTGPAVEATPHAPARRVAVSTVAYDLGDRAYRHPDVVGYEDGKPVRMELAGVVHHPARMGRTRHPLVMMVHGSWWTCVDVAAGEPTGEWPCPAGRRVLRSNRGYDYLGRALARRGFVVVSISANAINAHVLGDSDYFGRAHLLNRHLQMWRRLAATGTGPLAGAFTDPRTGDRARPRFHGRLDLHRVGTLGHSRGGKAVMWHAADRHRSAWPAGVQVRAVLGLAPVYFVPPGGSAADTRVTRVPFKIVTAACDGAVSDDAGRDYVADTRGRNPDASWVRLPGANHNHFNTAWSPGRIGGYDDARRGCRRPTSADEQRHQAVREIVPFFVRNLAPR